MLSFKQHKLCFWRFCTGSVVKNFFNIKYSHTGGAGSTWSLESILMPGFGLSCFHRDTVRAHRTAVRQSCCSGALRRIDNSRVLALEGVAESLRWSLEGSGSFWELAVWEWFELLQEVLSQRIDMLFWLKRNAAHAVLWFFAQNRQYLMFDHSSA